MKMVSRYDVNGQTATNMKEVSELLGRTVTKKDIMAGKVEGVTHYEVDMDEVGADTQTETSTLDAAIENGATASEAIAKAVEAGEISQEQADELMSDTEGDTDEATIGDTTGEGDTDDLGTHEDDTGDTGDTGANKASTMDELRAKMRAINAKKAAENTQASTNKGGKAGNTDQVEYPEKGTVKTEKELKKFYKKLSDSQLDEWLELEGLTGKVKLCDHEAINRMRKCMAIMDYHFPKATSGGKKKSKYADYTTEELCRMAIEHDIPVKDDKGDIRILRMYTIMALKEAKILD